MGTEIELKLSLPHGSLAALRRHPILQASPKSGNACTLDNTYYDTPDLRLRQAGIALRIRSHGRRRLQTVKCAAVSTGGLSQRPEWEQPLAGDFDFSAIDDSRTRKRLLRHQSQLIPLFNTRFRRETHVYQPTPHTRILILIDTGELVCGEHRQPISEVELELDSGTPLDLLQLAHALVEDLPLLPDDTSKAARGFALLEGQPARALKAGPPILDPSQTPVEAFRSLAADCLRQWQGNIRGTVTSDDPEFIHQLRVSQRRLRSLIRLFTPALPTDFVTYWLDQLRHNANRLGEARDLDVLAEEILMPVKGTTADENAALLALRALVDTERQTARQHVASSLNANQQAQLLLAFNLALYQLPTNNLIGAVDLATFTGLQLDVVRRKARKRYRAARNLEPTHLHALRLSFKQLRYGVEFFTPLMAAKSAARYAGTLTRVQNALGFINDLDVARDQLARLAGDDPQLLAARAFVCGWHGPRYHRLSRRAIAAARSLVKGLAPWEEGQ